MRKTIAAQLHQSVWSTCLAVTIHLARREAYPPDLVDFAAEVARNQSAFGRRVWS